MKTANVFHYIVITLSFFFIYVVSKYKPYIKVPGTFEMLFINNWQCL